ncbi:hypothetical protein EC988_007041, partial [Linderina pennispora]
NNVTDVLVNQYDADHENEVEVVAKEKFICDKCHNEYEAEEDLDWHWTVSHKYMQPPN